MTAEREPDRSAEREAMVSRQLARRGITDERVLAAMRAVPRELFVPADRSREAYGDHAVPLGAGQTVSQPWIVAAICQALGPGPAERVLEIGTGSGYSAAVLARMGADVVSIERIPELATLARANLARAGVAEVEVICGDGSLGLPERAPFGAIAVHAVMPAEPKALLSQLAPGGRLVAPLADPGSSHEEHLVRWYRAPDGQLSSEAFASCRFVPLIGAEGYAARGKWRR